MEEEENPTTPEHVAGEQGVEVPHTRLADEVLRRVMEEFVTRAGTDYGEVEKTLGEKVADVRRQLERGEAVIVYEATSETINIVVRDDPQPRPKGGE